MKVLVIGATGHLGANTAIELKTAGHDIVAVGRRKSDNGFFSAQWGIHYIGDFYLENENSYKKLPTDIDAIVHLGGTMPAHADKSPMPYVQSIIVGMVNLCEWAKNTNCKRIVFNTTPSDIAQYFEEGNPVSDDAPRSFPKNGGDHAVYAISKNAASDILEHYYHAYGISYIVFRHLTVYGYHPNPYYYLDGVKKMLPWRRIIKDAMYGDKVEIWGDKERKKELLYIKDFTQAVRLALEKPQYMGFYNISGDRPYTMEEQVVGIVKAFSTDNTNIVFCPEKPNTPQNLLNSDKLRKDLGWVPKFDWYSACKDMKKEMEEQPFKKLWGEAKEFED